MQDPAFHRQIRQLYKMLFELATGNLAFRIDRNRTDDADKLADTLNTFAAQMQLAIKKSGHVVPYYTHQNLIHSAMLLDGNFLITGYTRNIPKDFGRNKDELMQSRIELYLSPDSKPIWKYICEQIAKDGAPTITDQLYFITANNQVRPSFCTICRLSETDTYLVSFIGTTLRETPTLTQTAPLQPSDSQIIQNLYEYIMKNLDRPLPTSF